MLPWEGAIAAEGEQLCSHGRAAVFTKKDGSVPSEEPGRAPMGGRRCSKETTAMLPWMNDVASMGGWRCYHGSSVLLPWANDVAPMGGVFSDDGGAAVMGGEER